MSAGSYDHLSQSEDHIFTDVPVTPLSYPPAANNHGTHRDPANVKEQQSVKAPFMPHVYYDDGPFDAPSSDSEEDTLLEKDPGQRRPLSSPGTAERELGINPGLIVGQGKRRPTTLRYLIIALGSLILTAIVIGIIAAHTYTGTTFSLVHGSRHITMDHVFNGTFYAQHAGLRWVPEAGDGVYAEMVNSRGVIQFVDLKNNSMRDLVSLKDVKNEHGLPMSIGEWKLSPDMKYMLIKTDYKKQWRHSSFGNYYVHDISASSTYPLIPPTNPPTTAFATWSPTGEAIAFVKENDIYVVPNAAQGTPAIRLTTTGSVTLFHGVPDWVYEEEVFSSDFTLWWSPDAKKVAYLSLDETAVDEYEFPIYNPSNYASEVHPYTEEVVMRYPKPGYANPLVEVHVFDLDGYLSRPGQDDNDDAQEQQAEIFEHIAKLSWTPHQPLNESIVFDVAWVGPDDLLLKEVNRAADDGAVVHFDTNRMRGQIEVMGTVVRRLGKNGEEGDDGWIESRQSITPLPPSLISSLSLSGPAYLDLVNNSAGYQHIALFAPADSSKPVFITDGDWEVIGEILGVDSKGIAYFAAAYPASTQRSIFAAPIPSTPTYAPATLPIPLESSTSDAPADIKQLTALTDTDTPAWYEASFSPQAGYYLLSYRGPEVPWQSVFKTGVDRGTFEYKVTDNARLNQTISEYQNPLVEHSTIESDGYELNVMEILPPNFDDTGRTKYPVLFRVYGGPNSQMVHNRFERDWHTFLACSLKYIVVVVDGRGTCCKGRGLRNPIKGNLGYWETKDQIEAARVWATKPYVDTKKIGIWGWSYGGFMSSKVIEANAGIHSLAMAVAPVTSWRLYDSIYTERYMSTPQANPDGYVNASITNVTGFYNADFLLAHGSGDDNVHFANSAHLLDMFTEARVRDFRFRMFTDSDHSIGRRGAYRELHEFMTAFLLEKWGKGGTRRSW